MAFASLFALVALVAVSRAAPTAVCSDGTRVSNSACCAFVPIVAQLNDIVFGNDCGEDGGQSHEAIRLTFRQYRGYKFTSVGPSGGTGADGSLLLFSTIEPEFHANNGIDDSVNNLLP
ncbi:hypothetical protein OBBRIDRAFT_806545, partial [Obba rivulosa]